MTDVDLLIRGGLVANAGSVSQTDIGIRGETIVQLGGDLEARRTIDATGKVVVPGGVDGHVHLSNPPDIEDAVLWVDDFTSGTAAALAGGITTVGNMTFPARGELPLAALQREAVAVRREALADVFLHPVLSEVSDEALDQIPRLLAAGCNTLKIFMVAQEFDRDARTYVQAVRRAGAGGLLTMIHCEDDALIHSARHELSTQGKTDLSHYPAAAPVVSEAVAVQRAVAIAELTGSPIYIVHLSSRRALDVCTEAQARGVPVYVETRPLYLHLTSERFARPDGPKYVGQPPLREAEDVDALWHGLRQGTVHTVCSDHAPYSLADKMDPAHTIVALRAGVENLQLLRPMLYSEGVVQGRISLERFVEVTSTNAARLFGLYPRKGAIAVGSEADIAIFDPTITRTVDGSVLHSNADYSVYEGWEVTGWPVYTIARGEIVFQDGAITAQAGRGKLVAREATRVL